MNFSFCYGEKNGIDDKIAQNAALLYVENFRDDAIFVKDGINEDENIKILIKSNPGDSSVLNVTSKQSFYLEERLPKLKGFNQIYKSNNGKVSSINLQYNPVTFGNNKKFIIDNLSQLVSDAAAILIEREKNAVPVVEVKVIEPIVIEEVTPVIEKRSYKNTVKTPEF